MASDTLMEDLARGWETLVRAGRPFAPLELVPFLRQAAYRHDEKHAVWYASRMYAEAGLRYGGGAVEPAALRRVPAATGVARLEVPDAAVRLVNPPHPRDAHGVAVAEAIAAVLKDRRNAEARYWTLEAARSLAALPCGLRVRYVLEWEVAGYDHAQLLLLDDVEVALRKRFDPRFKVHPVKGLSAQALAWGVRFRRDFGT